MLHGVMRPHACADCATQVPPSDDESALISMKYGWRLTRKTQADGSSVLEWRCPRCWARYRESRHADETRKGEGGNT
jgi:hypothetical protein